jgi:ABC-type spermidine/putrescine transport system permease subunit II
VQNRTQWEGLAREIGIGGGFGISSGVAASWLAARFLKNGRTSRFRTALAAAAALPGLLGPLILGLWLQGLFQSELLYRLYDTPVPLLLGLVLYLLPRALLLELLLGALAPRSALHAAQILKRAAEPARRAAARELDWRLRLRSRFWSAGLLVYWAYLDLTAATLLAPTGMVAAPVRLYNQMHFSRTAVLSVMTCATIVAPIICLWLLLAVRRLLSHWLP